MASKKVGPSDFRKEAEKMLREGTMPSLDEVLKAVGESRKEFGPKILEAQKQQDQDEN